MKKILGLAFILMIFCQVCITAEPVPDRWSKIGESEDTEFWIDARSINFYDDEYGNFANVWEMMLNKNKGTKRLVLMKIDLNRRVYEMLSIVDYDSKGKLKSSIETASDGKIYGFVPGSAGESVFEAVYALYKAINKQMENAA